MHPTWKFNKHQKWLEGVGARKGVCTKVCVIGARKPNSGLRKVAFVRLSNGRVVKSYIPGIGHNLQVHSVVLVRGGRHRDTPGTNYTCVRGKYDLLPVKNRKSARSRYGVKRPQRESKYARRKEIFTSVDRRLHFYRFGGGEDYKEPLPFGTTPPAKIPYVVRSHPQYGQAKPPRKPKSK